MRWSTVLIAIFLLAGLVCALVVVFRDPIRHDAVFVLGFVFVGMAAVTKYVEWVRDDRR
jgi:hypothetical protein